MEVHGGKCPYCGAKSTLVKFYGQEMLDTTLRVFWWCESCNHPITERYDLVFKNIEDKNHGNA